MASQEASEFSDLKQMLNQLCIEEQQKIERTEFQPVTDFPTIVDSPNWEDNEISMIPIYLEGDNPGPVKLLFMQPGDIDRTLLYKRRSDPRLDIAEKLRLPLDREEEDPESWARSELEPMLAGVSSDGAPVGSSRLRYKQLLTDIVRYNSTGVASKDIRPVEMSPETEEKRVRQRLMANWEERGQTATGLNLLKWERLLATLQQVEPQKFPERDIAEDIRQCEKDIRRLNQQLWTQCNNKTLNETKAEMLEQEERPLRELIELQRLHEVDLSTLNSWPNSNGHLLQTAIWKQEVLAVTVERQMSDLNAEIEVLDSHIQTTSNKMRKVQTRAGRLAARDVRDPEAREKEAKRRLEHPEALGFMLRSWADVSSIKAISGSLVQHAAAVESSLDIISGAAEEAHISTRKALVDMGLRTGAEGIETEKQEKRLPIGDDEEG